MELYTNLTEEDTYLATLTDTELHALAVVAAALEAKREAAEKKKAA